MIPRASATIIAMTEMLIPAFAPAERPALWGSGVIVGGEGVTVMIETVVFVVLE